MPDISVHALGYRVGTCVANVIAKPNQAAMLGYGAEILLGSVFKVAILFLIAAFLGMVFEVSVLLLVSGLIRTLSGGAHYSAYYRCLVTSVLIIASLGYMIKVMSSFLQGLPDLILAGVLMLSFCLYWRYAPQAPLNKPLKSKAMKDKFRKLTLILALLLSILSIIVGPGNIISWVIAFGLLWQAFTLAPSGNVLIKKLDILLSLSWKGGAAKC